MTFEHGVSPLREATATFDFPMSERGVDALLAAAADTRRTLMMTQKFHYSRWQRTITAILRFAYGWLGYKGPPEEYVTILPNMRITSVRETELGFHVEARMESE